MSQPSKLAQSSGPYYQAYLVRFWRDERQAVWRASAQSVQSGELIRFATIQELFAFLEVHISTAAQTMPTEGYGFSREIEP